MTKKIIQGDTFHKDGNTNVESLTVNTDKSTNGIAGSIATVKKESDTDATDVAVFVDVSKINNADQLSAEIYALVSRVVNSVDFNGKGIIGANLVGRNNSAGNFDFVYGGFSQAENQGSGNVGFLAGNNTIAEVTGTGASVINIIRAHSSDVVIDNPNTTVNNAQGMHPSVQMTNGTIGQVECLYLDLDYDNTGSLTVTGDIAYVRAGNDVLPSVGGNIYFIKSDAPYPSEFAGSITAPNFIGNFNGQPSSYYNFRVYGLGTGVADNNAFTGDVLSIAETGYKRVSLAATNLPVVANGFIRSIYRTSSFKTYEYISDAGQIFYYVGGSWVEMYNTGNANIIDNVLDTSTTDLQTTSTGVNDEVYSFTIPANTLAVGDVLKIRFEGRDNSGNTTNKTMQLELAGQAVNTSNFISTLYSNNERFTVETEIIITSATGFRYSTEMKVQRNIAGMNMYGNIFDGDKSTGTFDIATANDVTLDLNNVVNGDLVIKTISVKHFKA